MTNRRKVPLKFFRFTHFPKNAPATPLVSHSFKTKDLKPFRFTHFQKSGGGPFRIHQSPITNHESLPVSALDSALTSKRAAKSFTSNTYEKHTQGEGGCLPQDARLALTVLEEGSRGTGDSRLLSTFNCQLLTVAFLPQTLAQTISRVLN